LSSEICKIPVKSEAVPGGWVAERTAGDSKPPAQQRSDVVGRVGWTCESYLATRVKLSPLAEANATLRLVSAGAS